RRENISTWTIPANELKSWAENELKVKAELAINGEGDFCSGEWCQFCRASVKCRARAEENLKLAQMEFKLPPLLLDSEIEEILGKLAELTKWANDISAYAAESAIHHGKQWHGFKVVEGRSNRKYSDEIQVAEIAKEHGYLDIYKQSLITLTEMEKLMGKKVFQEILGNLIVKPQGKLTLVPSSDKRQAVNVSNAENEFNEIGD
ncbi:MAG: DUF2800 domain-containing protein, partial [Lachnospirales bacterium]